MSPTHHFKGQERGQRWRHCSEEIENVTSTGIIIIRSISFLLFSPMKFHVKVGKNPCLVGQCCWPVPIETGARWLGKTHTTDGGMDGTTVLLTPPFYSTSRPYKASKREKTGPCKVIRRWGTVISSSLTPSYTRNSFHQLSDNSFNRRCCSRISREHLGTSDTEFLAFLHRAMKERGARD